MPNKFSNKQVIIIIGAIVIVIAVLVLIFMNLRPKPTNTAAIKLTVWGTEDQDLFAPIAGEYPYATVVYKQVSAANYESQVISALAAGNGPDVFEIGDHALPKWESVLASLPQNYVANYGAAQIGNYFPDVVAQDFTAGGNLYGLPLSIDTLAMFYNKDLLNSAGIAFPPKTWDDLLSDIPKLHSAVAIGGSAVSIPHATDLLSLLMLQNGTQMTSADLTSAQFAGASGHGLDAFNFYLQFANASSPAYTWSNSMGNAIDSFVQGNTAIMFGYASDLATIKAKAPFIHIGVAPMLQIGASSSTPAITVNYPDYNGFVVAKASTNPALAWNLVLYLATTEQVERDYIAATGNPPALRAGIQAYMNDPNLGIFATQALTAKSWYEPDDQRVSQILNAAIENVLAGNEDSTKALREAEQSVTQLM